MSDHFARKRNLESLKKEAKRWLDALRQNQPEARARFERLVPHPVTKPTLRDVQHALALEQGLSGWAELKQKLSADADQSARALAQFEEMALALLDAYRTGTTEAMARHWALTWHRRNHQGMRTYVQLDLGRGVGAANWDDDLTLDDARYLIAREHGFERWDDLAKYYANLAPASLITAKPIRVLVTPSIRDESPAWHSREWNAVLGRLRDSGADGIDAENQMSDAMLEDLSRQEQITSLRMWGSRGVTDAGLRHLARLPRLRHLDLGCTGVTDQGLEVLQALPELEIVTLAWTKVTDAGAAHLSNCTNLRDVNLMGTECGDGALRALTGKNDLCKVKSGNGVTDAGLALLHQFPAFRTWRGGQPKMGLLSYDASPNHLILRGSFTDQGMRQLAGLDGLFALNLDASELGITEVGLEALIGLPNLSWLAVDATDASMPVIARMPKLRFLGCQDTAAGDEGFVALSQSQSIEYIWGRRCHNLRTRGFAALARMPALRGLSVSCKNVADEGIAVLPSFPCLRELMPMDVPDAGYRHVARCENLDSLILMYCRETSDAATEHVVRLPRLKYYFASYTQITDRTPQLLAQMDSLERITFDSCAGVTNSGLTPLSRLPHLKELRVSGPKITAEVAATFPSRVRVHVSE